MTSNRPVEKLPAPKPLDLMRRIRDDSALSSTQKHVLHVATLRMDNATGKVRASHGILAADAGLSLKTVGRAMASPRVAIYVRTIDKPRGKDHWLNYPDVDTASAADDIEDGSSVSEAGQGVQEGGLPVPDTGHTVSPSASTSSLPSAYSSAVYGGTGEKEREEWKLTKEQEADFLRHFPQDCEAVGPSPSEERELRRERAMYEAVAREEGFDPDTGQPVAQTRGPRPVSTSRRRRGY